MPLQLMRKKHADYFKRVFNIMPGCFAQFDSTRLTFAFFAISGLDILNCLDHLSDKEKAMAIEWIYRLQVTGAGSRSGFQASTTIPKEAPEYQCGHVAMTYTGLAALLVLGDDLSRVDRTSIVEGLRACQNEDGSFTAMVTGCESDMRFLYCACCVSTILDDWSGIDKWKATCYILQSISYDGAIGQGPGLESHGGSTFCAVASLFLMDELNVLSDKQLERLKRWCLMRQIEGFQGRPGKFPDTCYSFWIGATLELLGVSHLSDSENNRVSVLTNQDTLVGGFAKYHVNENTTDPVHTYLGLCGLSLLGEPELQTINAALNISEIAFSHLREIHRKWRCK